MIHAILSFLIRTYKMNEKESEQERERERENMKQASANFAYAPSALQCRFCQYLYLTAQKTEKQATALANILVLVYKYTSECIICSLCNEYLFVRPQWHGFFFSLVSFLFTFRVCLEIPLINCICMYAYNLLSIFLSVCKHALLFFHSINE